MQTSSSLRPFDGEVLAELAHDEIGAAEVSGPVSVGLELTDHDGTVFAAMALEVGLLITRDVQLTGSDPWDDGFLPDRGSNGLAAPLDVAGLADVGRYHCA